MEKKIETNIVCWGYIRVNKYFICPVAPYGSLCRGHFFRTGRISAESPESIVCFIPCIAIPSPFGRLCSCAGRLLLNAPVLYSSDRHDSTHGSWLSTWQDIVDTNLNPKL